VATVLKTRQISRERLHNVPPIFLFILPAAIPIAIFHFVSGRIGNGLMASGAVVAGTVMMILRMRDEPPAEAVPADDPDDFDGWGDGGSVWLDGPSDRPLPGPFQAVWESIMQESAGDDSYGRERAPAISTDRPDAADGDQIY
jgi:hypothetical protein